MFLRFFSGGSPEAGNFLLHGQEKVTKEKAAPVHRPSGSCSFHFTPFAFTLSPFTALKANTHAAFRVSFLRKSYTDPEVSPRIIACYEGVAVDGWVAGGGADRERAVDRRRAAR